jgi:hypothetical protein
MGEKQRVSNNHKVPKYKNYEIMAIKLALGGGHYLGVSPRDQWSVEDYFSHG